MFFSGCASYEILTIRTKTNPPSQLTIVGNPDDEENNKKNIILELKYCESPRYLSIKGSSSATSKILAMGSSEAINGNIPEAEILFLELKGKEKNGSVENNLAIICELNSKYGNAFSWYTAAILIDPENTFYKKNFFFFLLNSNINFQNRP